MRRTALCMTVLVMMQAASAFAQTRVAALNLWPLHISGSFVGSDEDRTPPSMSCNGTGTLKLQFDGDVEPESPARWTANRHVWSGRQIDASLEMPAAMKCTSNIAMSDRQMGEKPVFAYNYAAAPAEVHAYVLVDAAAPEDAYHFSISFTAQVGQCQTSTWTYDINGGSNKADGRVPVNIFAEKFTPDPDGDLEDVGITKEELAKGFSRKLHFRAVRDACGQQFDGSWDITLRYAPSEPKATVALSGCTDIVVGGAGNLKAVGTPPGGQYKFTSNKPDVAQLLPMGSASTINALAPGDASVDVEYTSPGGKTVNAREVLHCVEVKSVNNGQPITVGMYDVNGKRLPSSSVPADVQPANTNRVIFTSTNTAAAAAALSGDGSLTIVTKAPGKTTLQGVTSCGAKTGPPVSVDVVPCDNEVIAQLKAQEKAARTRLENAIREATQITGDDEFDRAAREGPEHIKQLAQKTIELIGKLAAGSAASEAKGLTKAYEARKELGLIDLNKLQRLEHLKELGEGAKSIDKISDALTVGQMADDELNDRFDETAKAAEEMAIDKIADKISEDVWGVGKTAYEAAKASMALGQDLGTMVGAADRLEELEQHISDASREFDRVWKLLNQTCKVPKPQQPQSPGPAPQKPAPSAKKTAAGGGMKVTDVPAEAESRSTTKKEPPVVEPPREQPKSATSGLFRDEELQCREWRPLPQAGEGAFNVLSDNLKLLQNKNEMYRTETLEPLAKQLEATRQIVLQMAAAHKLPADQRAAQIALLRQQIAANPPARFIDFAVSMEEHDAQLSACAPALQNSFEVKIEDLKLKY